MKLGELIKQYRDSADISQRELARRCGLSNSYISFIEKDKNPKTGKPMTPTIEMYKKLADAMGMSLQNLFSQLDDDVLDDLSPEESESFSSDERHLVHLYRGADDRARKDAVRTLEEHQIEKEEP